MGQFFLTITDGLFRLKDIVSSTSGYHLCLNCNLTQLFFSTILRDSVSDRLTSALLLWMNYVI